MWCVQDGPSPFKSMAEKVREFQTKTPVRFKTKPGKQAPGKQRSPITKAEVGPAAPPVAALAADR